MGIKGVLLGTGCLLGIAGCATAYQKSGMTGGFGEKQLSENSYAVYFQGNGNTSEERVGTFWIHRCAELTLEKGYQYFLLQPYYGSIGKRDELAPRAGMASWSPRPDAPRSTPALWRPSADGGRFTSVKGHGGTYYYTPVGGGTSTTWSSRGTVVMFHAPLPDDLLMALDAKNIIDQLQTYMSSDGSRGAVARQTLLHNAVVAHAQITYPSVDLAVRAVPARAGSAAPSGSPSTLRSVDDIRERILREDPMFQLLFRSRKVSEGLVNGGQIVLSFKVSQEGYLQDCQLVSTSFTDKGFVDAFLTQFRSIEFIPEDVAATVIPSFPITFTPSNR